MQVDRAPRRGDWPANPTLYQIYPRSFQDTTGTGEGDLPGITKRLDHIADLGVDGIWLSPFFASPMCDGGYDVADAMSVDPRFGTLKDFDALVERAHALGLLVMIDQVFNHTSDTHEWFRKSLAGEGKYADFYVWADARPDGSPPSNWIGYFGKPSWVWHPQRGQYCLHQFLPCQPGLNHRNPEVNQELRRILSFWRDRGVDGFRFDAITSFYYDPDFRDNPPAGDLSTRIPGPPTNPFTMQQHVYDMLPDDCAAFTEEIRTWAGEGAYLMGEINEGPHSVEVLQDFTKDGRLDSGYVVDLAERGLTPDVIADVLARMDAPGKLVWWLSCHDQKRQVSREGDGSPRDARMLAAFLLAMPGPVLLYQGEELGTPQADLSYDALRDPFDLAYWPDPPGRDGARTPMAWDDGTGMGFTTAAPWLPMACPPDGHARDQRADDDSVLSFYKQALSFRKSLQLADADIDVLHAKDMIFAARLTPPDGKPVCLLLNLSDKDAAAPDAAKPTDTPTLQSATQPGQSRVARRSAIWWIEG